jgi:hypothetical protein
VNAIRATITAAMCIGNFASQVIERHNKPEVETKCAHHRPLFCFVFLAQNFSNFPKKFCKILTALSLATTARPSAG